MAAWLKPIKERELGPVEMVQGVWKRYVSCEKDGRGMIFGMGCLKPGEEISHKHVEEELFYVLSGRGTARWEENGKKHSAELKPGLAFYKTSHIYHSMRNTGKENLIGLFFKV